MAARPARLYHAKGRLATSLPQAFAMLARQK